MNRRDFTAAAACLAVLPPAGLVRASRTMHRIAWMAYGKPGPDPKRVGFYLERLAQHGFVLGRNLEMRFFEGRQVEEFATLTRRAVAWNPDVIRVTATHNVKRVLKETRTIPIVFVAVNDPVASGLVESIRRPGGSVTGVMVGAALRATKQLEITRELLPHATRIGMIVDGSARAVSGQQLEAILAAARKLGFQVEVLDPSRETRHVAGAYERTAALRLDALLPVVIPQTDSRDGPEWIEMRKAIVRWRRRHRIPIVGGVFYLGDGGEVVGIGASSREEWELAAEATARILKGESPAEVAVQQVSRIELIVDLRTARELGIAVPKSLLLRADRVIE